MHDAAARAEYDPDVQIPEGAVIPEELQKFPEGHSTQRLIFDEVLYKKPMAQSESNVSEDVVRDPPLNSKCTLL